MIFVIISQNFIKSPLKFCLTLPAFDTVGRIWNLIMYVPCLFIFTFEHDLHIGYCIKINKFEKKKCYHRPTIYLNLITLLAHLSR